MPTGIETKTWTDAHGKHIECIHRYSRNIVGLSHPNKRGVDRLALIKRLAVGTKLVLVPEPDNPLDRNAILIYATDDLDNDLGYLESSAAKYIARMMECGATFSAEVYYVRYGYNNFPSVHIYIYHLTPMTQKIRPIRRGAPKYKPELPAPRKHGTASADVPTLDSFEAKEESIGLLAHIKRFFLLE